MRKKISTTSMAAGLALMLSSAVATPVLSQVDVWSRRCQDPGAGTLGIQGLRCEGCSFAMGRSGITQAVFRTEPEVLVVDRLAAEGESLRAGDILVAVDGHLITTRVGQDRLTSVRLGDEVTLRVRRDGRLRELRIVAGSACEATTRQGDVVAPEPPTPVEPASPMGVGRPPTAPRASTRPEAEPASGIGVSPRAPMASVAAPTEPAPPLPPSDLLPEVTLGFSFECSSCGYQAGDGDRGGRWFFTEPPSIYRVDRRGPAWEGGLRQGDVILAVDGFPLTSEEGASRFTQLQPGRRVVWTVRRDGQERTVGTVPGNPRPSPAPDVPEPYTDRLRFTGHLGPAEVEVRGAPVTVTVDRETGVMTITSAELTVYVRVPPGGSGSNGG